MGTVFWNREITDVVSLAPVRGEALPVERAVAAEDGTLLVDGGAYTGALLVDPQTLDVTIRGRQASETRDDLFLPDAMAKPVQLRSLVTGLVDSGIGRTGSLSAWPTRAGNVLRGTVTLTLSVPENSQRDTVIVFRLPRQDRRSISIKPGQTRQVVIPIRSRKAWKSSFAGSGVGFRLRSGTAIATLDDLRFRLADDDVE